MQKINFDLLITESELDELNVMVNLLDCSSSLKGKVHILLGVARNYRKMATNCTQYRNYVLTCLKNDCSDDE